MKAAVFYGKNDLRVEERNIPEIGRNDVLVRVHALSLIHILRQGYTFQRLLVGSRQYRRMDARNRRRYVALNYGYF